MEMRQFESDLMMLEYGLLLPFHTREVLQESLDRMIQQLKQQILSFKSEAKTLIFFINYIKKRSSANNSKVSPKILEDIITLSEVTLIDIQFQLSRKQREIREVQKKEEAASSASAFTSASSLNSWWSFVSSFSFNGRKQKASKSYEKLIAESIHVLENAKDKIWLQVEDIGGTLPSFEFEFLYPRQHLDEILDFLDAIKFKLDSIPGKSPYILDFGKKLTSFRIWLQCLAKNSTFDNAEIDRFSTLFGSVLIRAALWSNEYHPVTGVLTRFERYFKRRPQWEDKRRSLEGLQWEIDFSNPDFVDMNLRILRGYQLMSEDMIKDIAVAFVQCLLDISQVEQDDVGKEVMSLVTLFINLPEECTEDLPRLWIDVRQVIQNTSGYQKYVFEALGDDFKAETWLLGIEVLLRVQLSNANRNKGVRKWTKSTVASLKAYLQERKAGHIQQIVALKESVSSAVECLHIACQYKKLKLENIKNVLFQLLAKIMLVKAASFLGKLPTESEKTTEEKDDDDTGCLMALPKDQIVFLLMGIEFVIADVWYLPVPGGEQEEIERVFQDIEAISKKVISRPYFFTAEKVTEEIEVLNRDFLGVINHINTKLRKIMLPSWSKFPKTDGLGFTDSLLKKLHDWVEYKIDFIAPVKKQIEEIIGSVEFLRSSLNDMHEKDIRIEDSKDVCSQIISLVYEIEYRIDMSMLRNPNEWYLSLLNRRLMEDVKCLHLKANKVREKKSLEENANYKAQISNLTNLQDDSQRIETPVIILRDQEEEIIDRLVWDSSLQQRLVPITGMPGSGKTTIARKLYSDPRVTHHFHVRAWCYVSQRYEKRRVLLEILSHFGDFTEDHLMKPDEDLELELFRHLKGKRYLIFLDDIWDVRPWHDLRRSFPDDENGSRILFTTRDCDVALKADPDGNPHALRLLSAEESGDLLRMKIFHEEEWPTDLIVIGKQIAESCGGLPLSIVAIAGVLERTGKRQDLWKRIAESLSLLIIDDPQTRCKDILELSYKNLPDYLKACFLYVGALVEDKDVPVSRLTWLWMAEGFVRKSTPNGLEDLAMSYLMDLIKSNLVMISKTRSIGGVKACRVHDLLRELCISKAKEENFLHKITRIEEANASSDGPDYGVDLYDTLPSDSIQYEDHRLFILSKRKHFITSRPSGLRVRSLLFFAATDMYPRCPYDLSFIFDNFKLLKILDLGSINMGVSFPHGVELLTHLRYLAISGDIDAVPSNINCLWNLETLLLKGLKGKVIVPDTIWHMESLRHLHVDNYAVFSLEDDILEKRSKLNNLVTLSSPIISSEDAEKMTRRFPNLQRLRCLFFESGEDLEEEENHQCFPRLDLLTQLESLTLSYLGRAHNPGKFRLPLNLKKLTLSNFCLPWSHISTIGSLPNLEVLKLLSRAFEGEEWDMFEGEFPKLKFLKLESLNIIKWNASSDHLPSLQRLVLRSCKLLEEVPYFGDFPTLEMIELCDCSDSCVESVRSMTEDSDALKVIVSH